MNKFTAESLCRICMKKQDTMYSLFTKRKDRSPSEKLSRIGIRIDENDPGLTSICCDCLAELDITINFIEKCEKSNAIQTEHLFSTCDFPEEIVSYKDDDNENMARWDIAHERTVQKLNVESVGGEQEKNRDISSLAEAKCGECGSKRRCRHWAPPATHTCPYCQKVFTRKFNFKLHLKRHVGEREWWCGVCGASAVSRWLAARHCGPRRRRACPVPGCGKTYTTNTNLNTHLRVHTGERPFECTECGKTFTSKNTLNDHMKIHTGALPYICPVCGKRFRTNKLSAHMSTHCAQRLVCARAACAQRFASRRALARHARAAHPPRPPAAPAAAPHACRQCPARYRHKQSLNKHARKMHAQKPAPTDVQTNDITEQIESSL